MKHSDLLHELHQDSEYNQAMEELKLHFAVANAVLRARLQKGWSQAELADAIGTKQANISRIEAGLANPSLSFLQRLFQVLDLDLIIQSKDQETELNVYVNTSSSGIAGPIGEAINWSNVCAPRIETTVNVSQATEVMR